MNNVAYFENLISYSPESLVPLFELILEKFEDVDKSKGIFNVFSAQSETLSSILAGLCQFRREFPPPYRSHLLMEVWQTSDSKRILRISFNGEVIKIFPLEEFVGDIRTFINRNKDSHDEGRAYDYSHKEVEENKANAKILGSKENKVSFLNSK